MLEPRLVRTVLEILLGGGADWAEIFEEDTRRTSLALEDGDLDTAASGQDGGIALRLVRGERTFFASTGATSPSTVTALARRLAQAAGGGTARLLPELRDAEQRSPSPVTISPDVVPTERKVSLLRRADAAARAASTEVTQVAVRYLDTVQRVRIATADGVLAPDERVICTLAAQVVARRGADLRTGYTAFSETRGFEMFDLTPPEETAREAARLALLQLDAGPAPAGTMTVVLGAEAGGTMVHEACGHGLEGDFAEKGLSVYAGRIGERVAADIITVVDDGTLPHRRGSCRVDDEGVPTSRVVLIENGILRGYLHSRHSARRLGGQPTGNGRRESFRHMPIPRMRNTMIAPGATPPADIIASVTHGLYVARMGGGEVDIASGQFVFHCPEAYLIRDGRLAGPVRDATLAGRGPDVLMSIDRVGSDLGFQVGTCGKDGQGVPVADAQPTLRIPALVVGGVAE